MSLESYLAIKRDEELIHAATCMSPESTLLSEEARPKDHLLPDAIHLNSSGQAKPQKQNMGSWSPGCGGGERSGCLMGTVLPFGEMKMF